MKLTLHVNGLPLPSLFCRRHERQRLLKYVIAMKLFIAIFAISLNVSANVYSQKVNISANKVPLEDVLKQIRIQTGVYFMFKSEIMNDARPVSVNIKNAELKDALQAIFKDQPYSYTIQDNAILIKRKPAEKNVVDKVVDFYSAITIRGRVVDENGAALPGVTVAIKGGNAGTVTDNSGAYKIDANRGNVLTFSFIGYRTEEVPVQDETVLNVVLRQLTSQLDQVQVIGYGTTTQRLNTGNVAVVRSNVISNQPVTNPLQALAGRVAGLQITQGSGLPGREFYVQIRGRNSIAASNNPLYIVDGVPFLSEQLGNVVGSPMNSISPEDIETISVLKDADATAIYGSRAANGVILITTKMGASGKPLVAAKVSTGWSEVSNTADLLSTKQYLQVRRDAFANDAIIPTNANAPDLLLWDKSADNTWQDWYMGRRASNTDASVSFSGGNSQTTFLLSGTYHRENTVRYKDNKFIRGNTHFNLRHHSLNNKFRLSTSMFYTVNSNYSQNLDMLAVVGNTPNYQSYNADGTYNWAYTNIRARSSAFTKVQTNNLNGNLLLEYTLAPGLDVKSSLGYNRIQNDANFAFPSTTFNPSIQKTGNSSFSNSYNQSLILEPQVTYSKNIGKGNLSLLLGSTIQRTNTKARNFSVLGYTNDQLIENPGYGTSITSNGQDIEYKYLSYFMRGTYNWESKYILNGTFRRDGSSRFGENRKFGNFGSIGAAWIFSNEYFLKDRTKLLTYGKLRASYGTTGSDGIGDYQYLSTYASDLPYGSATAIAPTRIANSNYSWEVNRKLEAALDLGFLEDRILLSTVWYRNRSGNQLVTYALPTITGFSGYTANLPAVVENSGWEFDLNIRIFRRGTFIWDSSINMTLPQNKLKSYPGLEKSSYANNYILGQPLNVVQLYHFTGVDPKTGLATILDVNGDGKYVQSSSHNNQNGDYIIAGTTDPKWYGGMNNTLGYKGLQLDIFLQYSRQKGFNLFSTENASKFGQFGFNGWTEFMNYWKQPDDIASTPKPSTRFSPSQTYYQNSNAGFDDASFLRLKNVTLSYNLSDHINKRLNFTSLKIYVQGQNLWTNTNYKGYDPEFAGNSRNTLNIPSLRTVVLGIQGSF